MRNGGHFSQGAAGTALRVLRERDRGQQEALEVHWDLNTGFGGPRLLFAEAIAQLAFLSGNRAEMPTREYVRGLFELVTDGYHHATTCVHLIIDHYLAAKFGF